MEEHDKEKEVYIPDSRYRNSLHLKLELDSYLDKAEQTQFDSACWELSSLSDTEVHLARQNSHAWPSVVRLEAIHTFKVSILNSCM